MNKILDGAKQALAFVRGEEPAAHIHAAVGGPYIKDRAECGLIQVAHPNGYFIVWNWDTGQWDKVSERVTLLVPKGES